MSRVLDPLYRLCAVLSAFFLALIALLILAQAFGRWLGITVHDANELAGFSLVASAFLALAPSFRDGAHIRVKLLTSQLGAIPRRILEILALALSAYLVGYFAYWAVDLAIGSYEYNDVSPGVIAFPLWIPQSAMAFGLIVFTLCIVQILLDSLRGKEAPYEGLEGEVQEHGE